MNAAEFPQSGRRRVSPADAAMASVILVLGLFLAATGGSIVQRWRSSSGRQQSLGFEDQLGVAANTAGLIVIVWWAMSLVIAVAAALFERCGNARAASAAGKFTPAFMRRLALAAVGFQLVTAPLATASPCRPSPDPPGPRRQHPQRGRRRRSRPHPGPRRPPSCQPPGRHRSPAPRPWSIHNGGLSARSSNPVPWRAASCDSRSPDPTSRR